MALLNLEIFFMDNQRRTLILLLCEENLFVCVCLSAMAERVADNVSVKFLSPASHSHMSD